MVGIGSFQSGEWMRGFVAAIQAMVDSTATFSFKARTAATLRESRSC
jgi:hypothetical protein